MALDTRFNKILGCRIKIFFMLTKDFIISKFDVTNCHTWSSPDDKNTVESLELNGLFYIILHLSAREF